MISKETEITKLNNSKSLPLDKVYYFSKLSHELRTPMNSILGLTAMALQEKNLSVPVEDYLKKIDKSSHFLLSIMNDLLDISIYESGHLNLNEEVFSFEDLFSNINTYVYEKCGTKGIDYTCNYKTLTEDSYIGDEIKLQQIFINILDNSVQFTPSNGKISFYVEEISKTKKSSKLRFIITDNGMGIDKENLQHIFEPFNQLITNNPKYSGTGLGLTLAKNFIDLMNGTIKVESEKNKQTVCTIELELNISKNNDKHNTNVLTNNSHLRLALIIDDDEVICKHTQMTLQKANINSDYVLSGKDALEKIKSSNKNYNLILVDWKMPEMNGIETTKEIKKLVNDNSVIIMITAGEWSEIENDAKNAGVDMFMNKPVFASSVINAYNNILLTKKSNIIAEKEKNYNFKNFNILVAEDNELNKEIIKNQLEYKSCNVDSVSNGIEVIKRFSKSETGYYNAILMDVQMPIMNGLEATKAIREMQRADSKTIPIIAMTANALPKDIKQSLDSGMNAHLTKPINPSTLYETLAKYLNKNLG